MLEKALFTQSRNSTERAIKLIESLETLTESKEFIHMNLAEQVKKVESLNDAINAAKRDATRYKKNCMDLCRAALS